MCGENVSRSPWIRALGSKNLRNYHLFIFGRSLSTIYLDRSDSNLFLFGTITHKKAIGAATLPTISDWITDWKKLSNCPALSDWTLQVWEMSVFWVLLKLNLLVLFQGEKVCQGPWMHICKWDCTSRTWYWKLMIARHLFSWAYKLTTGRQMAAGLQIQVPLSKENKSLQTSWYLCMCMFYSVNFRGFYLVLWKLRLSVSSFTRENRTQSKLKSVPYFRWLSCT